MKSLELFSGAGGMAKGLELAGFDHSAFVEFNKDACATLRLNFDPRKVYEGDIREFNFALLRGVDIVAGGPPCQPFSLGGKHKASDDSRDMFPEAIRAINVTQPRAFVFENVKGLLRQSFADYFEYIRLRLTYPESIAPTKKSWWNHLERLRALRFENYTGVKYNVQFSLINAADYGVPQKRERVVIVGTRADVNRHWTFPTVTHSEARLIWDKYVSGEYWDRFDLPKPKRKDLPQNVALRIEKLRKSYGLFPPSELPWQTVRDALRGIPEPNTAHGIPDHIFRDGARSYPGHTGSAIDLPAKTIKAGGHGVPGGENMLRYSDGRIRYFTVHEAKLIQSFPADFAVTGSWGEALRQIGNAVPVILGRTIGTQLFELVSDKRIGSVSRLGKVREPV